MCYNKNMETKRTLKERNRREKIIELLGGQCVKCQSTKRLEVAHINPEDKSFYVSGGALRKSWETILEELKKCHLICQECNKEKKRLYMGKNKIEHGTASMYTNNKCRCDACRAAWNAYSRKYTQKYREANPERIREAQLRYLAREMERDPEGTKERQRLASRKSKAKARKNAKLLK